MSVLVDGFYKSHVNKCVCQSMLYMNRFVDEFDKSCLLDGKEFLPFKNL